MSNIIIDYIYCHLDTILETIRSSAIAIIAVYIAYQQKEIANQQKEINHRKLQLDLYDRRLEIYSATINLMHTASVTPKCDYQKIVDEADKFAIMHLSKAHFLLNEEATATLKVIQKEAYKLSDVMRKRLEAEEDLEKANMIERNSLNEERKSLDLSICNLKQSLASVTELNLVFDPYVNFTDLYQKYR